MTFTLILSLIVACSDSVKTVSDHDGDGVDDGEDCSPFDAAVSPDEAEICDGRDNDCDGLVDDADPDIAMQGYLDTDGDGFAGTPSWECDLELDPLSPDCDDTDAETNPAATEDCVTEADDNCDGSTNEIDANHCDAWLIDEDGDLYGGDASICACESTPPYSTQTAGDCDDADARVNPGLGSCWLQGSYTVDEATAGWFGVARESDGVYDGQVASTLAGAGDVNGDGRPDLLIGAFQDNTVAAEAGAVYLVYGPTTGTHTLPEADATVLNDGSGELFGQSVTGPGDVDGDGYADLLIAQTRNAETSDCAGRLVGGPISGTSLARDVGLCLRFTGDGDLSLMVSPAGDANDDGLADMLVTVYWAPNATYLLPGPGSDGMEIEANATAKIEAGTSCCVGLALSGTGDADGDGAADIWVSGSDVTEPERLSDVAYRFNGPLHDDMTLMDADATIVFDDTDAGLGWDLSIDGGGDLDGDGASDVVVGTQGETGSHDRGYTGDLYVQYGLISGRVSADDLASRVLGDDMSISSDGSFLADNLGQDVVSPGDIDGDGADDLLATGEGLFNLYYGPLSGSILAADADARLGYYASAEEGDAYGSSAVAAPGDVDGDGTPDLLLGSGPTFPSGTSPYRAGAAFLFSGTPD